MQLKLVTFDRHNHSVSTQFINLEGSVSVEYRSLSANEFSSSNRRIPSMVNSDIVALVFQDHSDSIIEISRHQGAYLIDAGKTVEIINQPVDFEDLQIWVLIENNKVWAKEYLACYMDAIRQRRNDEKYKALPVGEDPNVDTSAFGTLRSEKPVGEMATVTWYRDRRQTSKTWRKWDDFAKNADVRFLETVVVREDTDPNQPGFKIT